jgi:hypothetical protein
MIINRKCFHNSLLDLKSIDYNAFTSYTFTSEIDREIYNFTKYPINDIIIAAQQCKDWILVERLNEEQEEALWQYRGKIKIVAKE